MPAKMIVIDFNKCRPQECGNGICLAAKVCEQKLLYQEKEYEIPLAIPSSCRGCSDCIRACPLKAVRLSKA